MATATLLHETKSVLWRIPKFAELCKLNELIKQQKFKFEMNLGVNRDTFPDLKWECSLASIKENYQNRVQICLYLLQIPKELSDCRLRAQFRVVGNKNEGYYLDDEFSAVIREFKTGFGPMDSLPQDSTNMPFLSVDGALEIRVTVTVFHPEVQDAALRVLQLEHEEKFRHNFATQLNAMREMPLNIKNTATKLVSKDGKQFPVDRVILSARSSVFRDLFQPGPSEEQNEMLEVYGMDSEPLEVLLDFIHKGKLSRNWKDEGVVEGLVYGAHMYKLMDLEKFLDQVVGLVCTDANCGKLMGLAKAFELKEAQKGLMEYFQKNMSMDVDKVVKFAEDTTKAAKQIAVPNLGHQEQGNGTESLSKRRKIAPQILAPRIYAPHNRAPDHSPAHNHLFVPAPRMPPPEHPPHFGWIDRRNDPSIFWRT